ncbi:unnamed protein product, partial [Rotaria magnacalcarata]
MLYEDSSEEENSERRFHVELHFSPGAYGCFDVLPETNSVTSNTNRTSTVLPKSNRQAAHSPPRHHIQIPIASPLVTLIEPNISSSLPLSPLAESSPVESSLAILTPSSKP